MFPNCQLVSSCSLASFRNPICPFCLSSPSCPSSPSASPRRCHPRSYRRISSGCWGFGKLRWIWFNFSWTLAKEKSGPLKNLKIHPWQWCVWKKPTVNQNQISAQTEGSVAPGPHFHCNRFGAPCDGAWQSGAWTNYVVVWSRLWHLQSNILRESYIYNMYNLIYIYIWHIYMHLSFIYHILHQYTLIRLGLHTPEWHVSFCPQRRCRTLQAGETRLAFKTEGQHGYCIRTD